MMAAISFFESSGTSMSPTFPVPNWLVVCPLVCWTMGDKMVLFTCIEKATSRKGVIVMAMVNCSSQLHFTISFFCQQWVDHRFLVIYLFFCSILPWKHWYNRHFSIKIFHAVVSIVSREVETAPSEGQLFPFLGLISTIFFLRVSRCRCQITYPPKISWPFTSPPKCELFFRVAGNSGNGARSFTIGRSITLYLTVGTARHCSCRAWCPCTVISLPCTQISMWYVIRACNRPVEPCRALVMGHVITIRVGVPYGSTCITSMYYPPVWSGAMMFFQWGDFSKAAL